MTLGTSLRAFLIKISNPGDIIATMPRNPNRAGWGGRRAGSGRPPGARNRRSKAAGLVAKVKAEALELPVDRLIRRLNDPELSEEYRDKLAAIVAPYTAPRLSTVSISKRPSQLSDEELAALAGLTEEDLLRLGEGRDNGLGRCIERLPQGHPVRAGRTCPAVRPPTQLRRCSLAALRDAR